MPLSDGLLRVQYLALYQQIRVRRLELKILERSVRADACVRLREALNVLDRMTTLHDDLIVQLRESQEVNFMRPSISLG